MCWKLQLSSIQTNKVNLQYRGHIANNPQTISRLRPAQVGQHACIHCGKGLIRPS